MSAMFVGRGHVTTRTVTGFRSLDLAFPQFSKTGEIYVGVPNNLPWLVYGAKGMGKTTFCLSIGGKIASDKKIVLRSIEGFDAEWTEQLLNAVGFTGKVVLAEGEENEEYNIDKFISMFRNDDFAVAIIDSIAAIQPEAELSADSIVEIQMGRRAQLTNKLMRHITNAPFHRESPIAFFAITHEYKAYSQYEKSTKPGGDGKQYLSRVHVKISREKWSSDKPYILEDGSYIIKGTIEEFNYGIKGKEFSLFMLANHGVHEGMTAVFDCLKYNVAKRKKGRIVLGDKSATLNELLREAHAGNDEFFSIYTETLKDVYGVAPKQKGEEEDDDDTE